MLLLIIYAFLAGLVTILSPCILPLLPIILSSAVENKKASKRKPFGIIIGFVLSFTFFTLFLSSIVTLTGISADLLRNVSIVVIAIFGFSILFPAFQLRLESFFSKVNSRGINTNSKSGLFGGILIGSSLGLLWTPCVGPILASVISLAAIGTIGFDTFLITLAYSLGTAIPMFLIMLGGSRVTKKLPVFYKNLKHIQQVFGLIMILLALGIFFGVDRKFQSYVLTTFPNYGEGITIIEDNVFVRENLDTLNNDLY